MDIVALRRIVGGMMSSLSIPTLRWATVTQASPLRIQYPTESEPLPFAPTALGPAPGLGADVLTVQWGTRVTILGTVGQGGPEALGAGVDLNTLTTPGSWYQSSNGNAASGSNYPVPTAGYLEVMTNATGNAVWQRYLTYPRSGIVGTDLMGPTEYVRGYWGTSWSAWHCVGGGTQVAGVISSKTYYVRKPDGELICRGSHPFPASAGNVQSYSWTFPIPFVGEAPHVTVVAQTGAPHVVALSVGAVSLTGCDIHHYRSTASANTDFFEARGRWK